MADTQEEVLYQYTGDVSSLKQATQQAISLLDKYDSAMKRMVSDDSFKASQTSAAQFQRTVNGIVRQVNTLTKSLNTAGDAVTSALPSSTSIVTSATKDIAEVLELMDNSMVSTSNDMKYLTQTLQRARSDLDIVAAKAKTLSSELKNLEQLEPDIPVYKLSRAAKESVKSLSDSAAWSYRVQDAYRETGKSAADSAAAIVKASSASGKITNVSDLVGRLSRDMDLFKIYASSMWRDFMKYLDPVTTKLQGFKTKTSKVLGIVKDQLSKLIGVFRRTSKSADDTGESAGRLSRSFTKASQVLKDLANHATKSNISFKNLHKTTGIVKSALLSLTGIKLGGWLSNAVNKSIEFVENLNLFTVAMGESIDQGNQFVDTMAELYGLDPSSLMRYAGNFYQLADAISMPDAAAANLSLGLTKATADISSLFNVPVEQVFENLSSGLQGMSRAVRKYGMDIRVVTLQQTALSLGITENVSNMSEANLQGLRFVTMMRQAANASDDFAETIESPANQLKIFKEQLAQLGRAIGDLFIDPLATAIAYINGFIMALRMAISFVSSLFNIFGSSAALDAEDTVDSLADSVSGVGSAAGAAAKELKGMLAPFDELNILQQPSSGSGGGSAGSLGDVGALDPAIENAIAEMQWKLDDVKMKAVEVRDALLEFFGFEIDAGKIIKWDPSVFENNLINKFPEWTKTIQATFTNWSDIISGFENIVKALGEVATAVWEKVTGFIGAFVNDETVSEFVSGLATDLDSIASTISENSDTIANFVLLITALRVAFTGLSTISSLVAPVASFISLCVSAMSPFSAVIGIAAAVIALLAALYLSSESFAESFGVTISHVIEAATEGINNLAELFRVLWNEYLWPVIQHIGEGLKELWFSTISPIIENVIAIIGGLIEIILLLWNNVLAPLVTWLLDVLAPIFVRVFNTVFDIVKNTIESIGQIINGLLGVLRGVIDIIVGVFTGDWARAWQGVVEVFKGIWNTIAGVVKLVLNTVIGILNVGLSAISGAVNSIIRAVNKISFTAPDWVPLVGGKTLGFNIREVGSWNIPYLAKGGVVSSPTMAMIGEGRYDEAVIPLGESPQMHELINRIAAATNRSNDTPIQVNVYIGNEQVAEYMHTLDRRRQLQTNGGT